MYQNIEPMKNKRQNQNTGTPKRQDYKRVKPCYNREAIRQQKREH
jgi:hypothetical protein